MTKQNSQLFSKNSLIFLLVALLIVVLIFGSPLKESKNKYAQKGQFYEQVYLESLKYKSTSNDKESINEQKTYVTKSRPKNVIFMIGDGMGLTQISAAEIVSEDTMALEQFRHIGLSKTKSTKLITDSAAGATAMSTGQKTHNGVIAMTKELKPLKTILEYAEDASWVTGIVTTSTVTHATPASFYGHQPTRAKVNRQLAAQFMEHDIEVLMGGGINYFNDRDDQRDLLEEARERGYFVTENVEQIGEYVPSKLLCLISKGQPKRIDVRGNFLPLATQKAIEVLAKPDPSFFLVVEGAQIDWAGHANNSDYIVEEMFDFDKAVAHALDFAKKDGNTLVVVTADHETGGYAINGWDKKKAKLKTKFTTGYHTGTMVPVFAYGPGAESFTGVYENTEIFYKFKHLMGLGKVQ